MNYSKKGLVYWLPRILGILFVLFISLFSLDVFGEYKGMAVIVPLVMHLIPSFILLTVVCVSWKYDLVGTVIFIAFAVWYTWTVASEGYWFWSVTLSGPALLVGILFLANWFSQRKNRYIN